MLTKNHIKARVRGQKVVPDFLSLTDKSALADATTVLSAFSDAVGRSLGDVREQIGGDGALVAAFFKLLSDRCDFEDFPEGMEETRWEMFALSRRLRSGGEKSQELFREQIADACGKSFDDVAGKLYADLPELRKVRSVELSEPGQLINRYNIAQVQGLLLKAHTLKIVVDDVGLKAQRQLFHLIRFHKLLADVAVDKKKKRTVITLTGPMGLFDQSSAYGLQLALFFPWLLSFEGWSAEAEVEHKQGKTHLLKIDESSGLEAVYKLREPYIPPELTSFLETFNGTQKEFKATAGGDVVNLGSEQYLIPDLTITGQGRVFSVELFHKWHASQLTKRLEILQNSKKTDVLLGVARTIAKGSATEKHLNESCWFAKYGVLFSDFPTAKSVLSLLGKICRAGD